MFLDTAINIVSSIFCFPACRTVVFPNLCTFISDCLSNQNCITTSQFCKSDLNPAVAFPSFLPLIRTVLPRMCDILILSKMVWNCFRAVFILKHTFLCYLICCSVVTVWIIYTAEKGPASVPGLKLHLLSVRKSGNARQHKVKPVQSYSLSFFRGWEENISGREYFRNRSTECVFNQDGIITVGEWKPSKN